MAGLGPKVTLTFVGNADDLKRVMDEVGTKSEALDTKVNGLFRGLSMGAALGSVGPVVGGVAGGLTQLAPAALLLPGALLAGGAAMQTFKLATKGFGDAIGAGLSGDVQKFGEAT